MVDTKPPANPLFLLEEELRQVIELMFYAYRDFTYESDKQLKRYQLGRAHHRALYFIGRHPGQTVGHLLSILKVTKQSISRVLKDLLEQGYVEQKSGSRDRRGGGGGGHPQKQKKGGGVTGGPPHRFFPAPLGKRAPGR